MVRPIAPVRGRRLWALVAACALTPAPAQAALGEPDPTYGDGGLASSSAPFSPLDGLVGPGGHAVFAGIAPVAGAASGEGRLVRLDPNGADDTGWSVPIRAAAVSIALAPAPGGGWVVASVDGDRRLFLTRVTPDGAVTGDTPAGEGFASVAGLRVLGDGRVVVTGIDVDEQLYVARFTAAFAPDGVPARMAGLAPRSLAVDALGRAVVAGDDRAAGAFVARFAAQGTLDESFANGGVRRVDARLLGVEVLGDGRIVLAGQAGETALLAGLTPAGAAEDGFGGSYGGGVLEDLLVDPVGGLYAAGTTAGGRLLLYRFDDRGRPDVTLRPDGFATVEAPYSGFAAGLDARERPYVLARSAEGPAAARFRANAAPVAAIAGPPRVPLGGRAVFDASGSADPERALRRFEWDLDGDGSFESDNGANPGAAHTFHGAVGEQRVAVRVTDHRGLQSTAGHRLQVDPPPGPVPVLGEAFVAEPVRGRVLVRRPGSSRRRRLMAGEQIPEGSIVDARRGRVRIVAARDASGATDSAQFYSGRFRISQTDGAAPYTTLALHGGDFSGCGPARPKLRAPLAETSAKRRRKRVVRRLWGDGRGRFRTKGRYASATVRGTKWQTIDRCDGVRLKVVRGAVDFRDLLRATPARRIRAGGTGFVPSRGKP